MPTPLRRPLQRVVDAGREGPLVVLLDHDGLYLRKPGTRTKFGPLPYAALFLLGGRQAAAALLKARAERKKLKQLTR
jgi:hypothetical protein